MSPTSCRLVLLIGSFWVAIAKYRLYEIDVIISKSVTYLGLGAVITGLYAAVVIVPLLVLGRSDDGSPGLVLPIVATAVVAVLFEPIRARMQRWANRLVYGDRATPHEVLSQVTSRLADPARDGAPTTWLGARAGHRSGARGGVAPRRVCLRAVGCGRRGCAPCRAGAVLTAWSTTSTWSSVRHGRRVRRAHDHETTQRSDHAG